MKNAPKSNQFVYTPQADSRITDLRVWMVRHVITFRALGKVMGGITGNGAHKALRGERMPVAQHNALLEFGVPTHLLPVGQDLPRGRRPMSTSGSTHTNIAASA